MIIILYYMELYQKKSSFYHFSFSTLPNELPQTMHPKFSDWSHLLFSSSFNLYRLQTSDTTYLGDDETPKHQQI